MNYYFVVISGNGFVKCKKIPGEIGGKGFISSLYMHLKTII